MASKPKQQPYNVMFKITMQIGIDIKAENLADAVKQAEAMNINDIVDFNANGWDHNDSERPMVVGVFGTR